MNGKRWSLKGTTFSGSNRLMVIELSAALEGNERSYRGAMGRRCRGKSIGSAPSYTAQRRGWPTASCLPDSVQGTESKHRASRPNHGFNLGHPLSGQAGVASVLCLCRKRRVIRGNLQTKIGKGSLVGMVSAGRSKLKRVETRDNGDKTRMGEVRSNV